MWRWFCHCLFLSSSVVHRDVSFPGYLHLNYSFVDYSEYQIEHMH